MLQFKVGQEVKVFCEVQRGAFPSEHLVTFESATGPISGFVREDKLTLTADDRGYLKGVIHSVSEDTISVMVRGSFFTTTGLAHMNRDWATSHLELAQAS